MSYCKIRQQMCSMVDDDVGVCGTTIGRCIYINEDIDDYRDYESTEDDSDEIDS